MKILKGIMVAILIFVLMHPMLILAQSTTLTTTVPETKESDSIDTSDKNEVIPYILSLGFSAYLIIKINEYKQSRTE